MTSKQLIEALKAKGYHLTIIEIDLHIQWHRLDRCMKGVIELKESEYKSLLEYAISKGIEV